MAMIDFPSSSIWHISKHGIKVHQTVENPNIGFCDLIPRSTYNSGNLSETS